MAKFYIKVVYATLNANGACFYYSQSIDSRYRVEYIPGEWVEPKLPGSKLMVYPTIGVAFNPDHPIRPVRELPFMGEMLWWCHIEGFQFPQQTVCMGLPDYWIEQYWQSYPFPILDMPKIYIPRWGLHSTVFASKVKLVSPVLEEELLKHLASA